MSGFLDRKQVRLPLYHANDKKTFLNAIVSKDFTIWARGALGPVMLRASSCICAQRSPLAGLRDDIGYQGWETWMVLVMANTLPLGLSSRPLNFMILKGQVLLIL